ncbi:unnamed protein product [Polarella glacialis]|uniref:Pentatricopeptide repeat-containing protein, chloroplastic n=1 Tax=Polarella glacialis TaxID=89957 RepID=A0A813FGE0_POLGL|nr:unnamed protein product [Polarella glacialis]
MFLHVCPCMQVHGSQPSVSSSFKCKATDKTAASCSSAVKLLKPQACAAHWWASTSSGVLQDSDEAPQAATASSSVVGLLEQQRRAVQRNGEASEQTFDSKFRDLQKEEGRSVASCAKQRRWQQGLGLLRDARKAGLELDVAALNAGLCCASGWVAALELLRGLRGAGLRPTEVSYGAAAGAISRTPASWPLCLRLLAKAATAGSGPGVILINIAISACGKAAGWARSLSLLSALRLRSLEPTASTCGGAVTACERAGKWAAALLVLGSLRHWSLAQGSNNLSVVWNAGIAACGAGGTWAWAFELLKAGRRTTGGESDIVGWNAAISACGRSSDGAQWAAALMTLRHLLSHGPEPDAININAAVGACASGAKAWNWCLHLLVSARFRGFLLDRVGDNAAMRACGRCSGWQWSLQLLATMRRHCAPLGAGSYCEAITSVARDGQRWEWAPLLLGDMRLARVAVDVAIYNAVAGALSSCDQWERSLAAIQDLHGEGLHASAATLNAAAAACATGQRWQEALFSMQQLMQDQVR